MSKKQQEELAHSGTTREHSVQEVPIAGRGQSNYCGICNGWYFRHTPAAHGTTTTVLKTAARGIVRSLHNR